VLRQQVLLGGDFDPAQSQYPDVSRLEGVVEGALSQFLESAS
jgi:hypothetical protein